MVLLQPYMWEGKFEIGVASVDEQHKTFFEILNRFQDAYNSGKGSSAVSEVLNEVIDYTNYHFAEEERLFKETDYPEAELHTEAHNTFKEKVLALQKNYMSNNKILTIELLMTLQEWLIIHIINSDRKFGEYIKNK